MYVFFQILKTSEQTLAERLAQKGSIVTREDISILLAEHLRTIEKLQQVSDAGKLIDQSNDDDITPRMTSSEGKVHSLKKRLGSGKTRRTVPPTEVDNQSIDSNFSLTEDISCFNETDKTTDINSRNLKANRLPPISQSKSKLKRTELPTLELRNKLSTNQKSKNFKTTLQNNENTDKDALHSSPETRIKNRRNLNESGIDSEGDDAETTGYEVGIGYKDVLT